MRDVSSVVVKNEKPGACMSEKEKSSNLQCIEPCPLDLHDCYHKIVQQVVKNVRKKLTL